MGTRRIAAVVGVLLCAGLALAGVRGSGISVPLHARLTYAPEITEYPITPESTGCNDCGFSDAAGVAQGPDGNMWVALPNSGQLAVVTPGGSISYITIPRPSWYVNSYVTTSTPESLALGPDGQMWVTLGDEGGIAVVSSSSQVEEIELPTYPSTRCDGSPSEIIAGPNGNMWLTLFSSFFDDSRMGDTTGCVAEINMSGGVTMMRLPSYNGANTGPDPEGIVLGPDGNVWVSDPGTSAIDRITPSGSITQFVVNSTVGVPAELSVGADGAIWFTELDNYWARESPAGANPPSYVGSLTTDGQTLEQYSLGSYSAAYFGQAPVDGALWFTDPNTDAVGGVTLGDYVGEYPLPTAGASPTFLTGASDGSLWASESNGPAVAKFWPPNNLGFAPQSPVQTLAPPTDTTPGVGGATLAPAFVPPTQADGTMFTNGQSFTVAADEPGAIVTMQYTAYYADNTSLLSCSGASATSSAAGQAASLTCTVGAAPSNDLSAVVFLASDGNGGTSAITYDFGSQAGPAVQWVGPTPSDGSFVDTDRGHTSFTLEAEDTSPDDYQPWVEETGVFSGVACGGNGSATYDGNAASELQCQIGPLTAPETVTFTATVDTATISVTFEIGPARYVAMGDSYSSGQGTGGEAGYIAGPAPVINTNGEGGGGDGCDRSPSDAYSELLYDDRASVSWMPSQFNTEAEAAGDPLFWLDESGFVACSGEPASEFDQPYNNQPSSPGIPDEPAQAGCCVLQRLVRLQRGNRLLPGP